jgi:YfiH family protein
VSEAGIVRPAWTLPAGVHAATTTRLGGVSVGPYASFNLGDHVGDDPRAVTANRARLAAALALPAPPLWLTQVHGVTVAGADDPPGVEADARHAAVPGAVCAVLTADCLPLLLCSDDGREIAAVHCGWRGVVGGIVAMAVARFAARPASLRAWLGPAIGPVAFEVGPEVREGFLATDAGADACFRPASGERWLADLPALTARALTAAGVNRVSASGACTVTDAERFFSYRRDGVTGRMATLIWRDG